MGTVAPPLPRVAAGTAPREDAGHLLDLSDVEQCVSDGIAWRDVDNRKLRQHARDLIGPLIPRGCAPEVVHPEEPALQQVLPQALYLRLRERGSTDVRTNQDRTLEQLVVAELHDPVVEIAAAVPADLNLGQFRESR